MSMKSWAAKEVELACKRERDNAPEGEWDYGVACYESALKAYNSLMEDGHSGMSFGITKSILNRLIDGKALTPIEDVDGIWEEVFIDNKDVEKMYQCDRMSSLFKLRSTDGTITYDDCNRCYCVDIDNQDRTYHFGFIENKFNEMFPITMPYMPYNKAYKIVCEDCLFDKTNGDFDTIAILYIITPKDERVDVNRYFKFEDNTIEINADEYYMRKKVSDERKSLAKELLRYRKKKIK